MNKDELKKYMKKYNEEHKEYKKEWERRNKHKRRKQYEERVLKEKGKNAKKYFTISDIKN